MSGRNREVFETDEREGCAEMVQGRIALLETPMGRCHSSILRFRFLSKLRTNL